MPISDKKQRNELIKLLQIFEELFGVTLGTWRTDPVDFKLKLNAKPICSQPYSILKLQNT